MEQITNFDRYEEVRVLAEFDNGDFLGRIKFGGGLFCIIFPGVVMNELELKLGDKFVYYPQKRNYILLEDCYKEPIKHEPLNWGEIAREALKKTHKYLGL